MTDVVFAMNSINLSKNWESSKQFVRIGACTNACCIS